MTNFKIKANYITVLTDKKTYAFAFPHKEEGKRVKKTFEKKEGIKNMFLLKIERREFYRYCSLLDKRDGNNKAPFNIVLKKIGEVPFLQ